MAVLSCMLRCPAKQISKLPGAFLRSTEFFTFFKQSMGDSMGRRNMQHDPESTKGNCKFSITFQCAAKLHAFFQVVTRCNIVILIIGQVPRHTERPGSCQCWLSSVG